MKLCSSPVHFHEFAGLVLYPDCDFVLDGIVGVILAKLSVLVMPIPSLLACLAVFLPLEHECDVWLGKFCMNVRKVREPECLVALLAVVRE